MALPLRYRVDGDRNAAERIESHRRGRLRAAFRASFLPLLRTQHGRDLAHVRDRWFDHRSKADAVKPAFGSRQIATLSQFGETAACGGDAGKAQRIFRVQGGEDAPAGEAEILRA